VFIGDMSIIGMQATTKNKKTKKKPKRKKKIFELLMVF